MNKTIPLANAMACGQCDDHRQLDFDFTMAFQPIVDVRRRCIFAYEALVRGCDGESAADVIARVNQDNRYAFDQQCRVKAIALAARLNMQAVLSINFLPNAVYQPELCIRTTLNAAAEHDFPVSRIMFEFTEVERMENSAHVQRIVEYYQQLGFATAIDDFGSGYSGLGLLADFQTGIVKLDMGLIRNIHQDRPRQVIVQHTIHMLQQLNIRVLAEGIETEAEMHWLQQAGIELMQGYWFARPALEALPPVKGFAAPQ